MQKLSEYDAVAATVMKYIDGIANSDTDLVAEAFHPQATMSGHFPDPQQPGTQVFRIVPAAEVVVAHLKNSPPVAETSPDFKGRILSIDLYDSIATATIAERALEGADFVTHFQLHKVDGQWLISAKATYGQPAES